MSKARPDQRAPALNEALQERRRGPDPGAIMRYVFRSSGYFTIFVLALILAFLLREGIGFSGQYRDSLQDYRGSGLEFVDLLERNDQAHRQLQQLLTGARADWIDRLRAEGLTEPAIAKEVGADTARQALLGFRATAAPIEDYVEVKRAAAIQIKDELMRLRFLERDLDVRTLRQAELINAGRALSADLSVYAALLENQAQAMDPHGVSLQALARTIPEVRRVLTPFEEARADYLAAIPEHLDTLASWEPSEPIAFNRALLAFMTGSRWITGSDQHDWYGLLPLLTGSLLIAAIALLIAIPAGVGSAIYVNQLASRRERQWIKPYIEFISALPSVVIGFFGIMIFGDLVRRLSQSSLLEWLPFFPVEERLNAFTAGCLLALMAIPTIFALTEEALSRVPRPLKEAAYAVGATRLQATFRTIVPSALPGIISAIMLGFGRVIGETMIVLMCAGNRIRIPDLGEGINAFFEPVHSMTGIIAQEMGEVIYGETHYRALFMVGIVLLIITLLVNYGAQAAARRFIRPSP